MSDDDSDRSRRAFLAGSAALLGGAGIFVTDSCSAPPPGPPSRPGASSPSGVVSSAAAVAPAGSSLSDVRHIVILMQENRSYDHYFGTLSGTRGFADPGARQVAGRPVFAQAGYQPGAGPSAAGTLQPFRLASDPPREDGQAVNDIAHDWVTQHRSWNDGAMDGFVTAHLAADGPASGPLTMGYYTRAELPFYYALADAFTVCDGYFCSVMGPTDPNRVMAMSGTIDPGGAAGGPVLITRELSRLTHYGRLGWETMPERLLAAGVSWKVYNDSLGLLALNPLPYFKPYAERTTTRGKELAARALEPTYPGTFTADVAAGTLPAVSWIIPPLGQCEHPAAPPQNGEYLVHEVLSTLVAHPQTWASTVLLVTYDENGGFFDHVPPPVPPPGTAGEYLTATPLPPAAGGIPGPVGPGFRTPALVVSPFARGGYRYSGTLDHTSALRLIEARFGVEAPNLSPWRRQAMGDFTGALGLGRPPDASVPSLPAPALLSGKAAEQAVLSALGGTPAAGSPYPLPAANAMPAQEQSPPRPPVP
ncbi:MAG TPA: alkaline phosphatase family protein [Trebonia sp.]|nr:alkaline phosphatase family protein [Trebonia sp.]